MKKIIYLLLFFSANFLLASPSHEKSRSSLLSPKKFNKYDSIFIQKMEKKFSFLFTKGKDDLLKSLGDAAKSSKSSDFTKILYDKLKSISILTSDTNNDRDYSECNNKKDDIMAFSHFGSNTITFCKDFYTIPLRIYYFDNEPEPLILTFFENVMIHELLHSIGLHHSQAMYNAYNLVMNDLGLKSFLDNGESNKTSSFGYEIFQNYYSQVSLMNTNPYKISNTSILKKVAFINGYQKIVKYETCFMLDETGTFYPGMMVPMFFTLPKIDEKTYKVIESNLLSINVLLTNTPSSEELDSAFDQVYMNNNYIKYQKEQLSLSRVINGNVIRFELFKIPGIQNNYLRYTTQGKNFLGVCPSDLLID